MALHEETDYALQEQYRTQRQPGSMSGCRIEGDESERKEIGFALAGAALSGKLTLPSIPLLHV